MSAFDTSYLFNNLPSETLDRLSQHAQEVQLTAGQVIFRQGDAGDGLYLVRSGEVEIFEWKEQARRRLLTQITSGEIFGEMAVLDGQPRSATATAKTEAAVCFVPSEEIMCLLEEFPELALKFLRTIISRLRKLNRQPSLNEPDPVT